MNTVTDKYEKAYEESVRQEKEFRAAIKNHKAVRKNLTFLIKAAIDEVSCIEGNITEDDPVGETADDMNEGIRMCVTYLVDALDILEEAN